jgi:hypothetical protein
MKHAIVTPTIVECLETAQSRFGDTPGVVVGPVRAEGGGLWSLTVYVPEGDTSHAPAFSPLGVAFTLRSIANRGHIEPRDIPSVHAAVMMLEGVYAQGRL